MKKQISLSMSLVLMTLSLGACGQSTTKDGAAASASPSASASPTKSVAPKPSISNDPVTLKVLNFAGFGQDAFNTLVAEPVKKKHPNLTLEILKNPQPWQQMIASKDVPDLLLMSPVLFYQANEYKLLEDLTPYIKKYNFDLARVNPYLIDSSKGYSEPGTIQGLPLYRNMFVLYYNKTLFDRFAVSYPKDGMTWDELAALSKKVTRTEGDTTYYGFDMYHRALVYNQLGLSLANEKTKKATLETDGWKKILNLFSDIYIAEGRTTTGVYKDFLNGQLSMLAWPNLTGGKTTLKFDWDMVTLPHFPEAPNKGVDDPINLSITTLSQHKEEAFEAINVLLSNEAQISITRNGMLSSLKDKSIQSQFGANLAGYIGKHTQAFYALDPVVTPVTEYDQLVAKPLGEKFKDMIIKNKDVNTALREAQNEADLAIQAQESK